MKVAMEHEHLTLSQKIPIWTTPYSHSSNFQIRWAKKLGKLGHISKLSFIVIKECENMCGQDLKNLGGKLVFIAEAEELT